MSKNIFIIFSAILLAIWQISFLYEFDFLINYLNFALVIIVLLAILINYKNSIIFTLTVGLTLDLFSPFSFGLITVALITTTLIIYSLYKKYFTQKSGYSLVIIMIISTIIFNLFLWLTTNTFYWFNWHDLNIIFSLSYLYQVIGQIILNTLVIILIWLLVKFVNKQIKTKFFFSSHS